MDQFDKTYLAFFALGDLGCSKHGRKVRIEVSSTHKAEIDLVRNLLDKYCKPIIYPLRKGLSFSWRIVCDLDPSFSFHLDRSNSLQCQTLNDDRIFFEALYGFVDAEGYIGLEQEGNFASPTFIISNSNKSVLSFSEKGLLQREIKSKLHATIDPKGKSFYQLYVRGPLVLKILSELRVRHREKIEVAELVRKYEGKKWNYAGSIYFSYRQSIRAQRNQYVNEAEVAYALRIERKLNKKKAFDSRVENALQMKIRGAKLKQIADSSQRSLRTIYRWIQKANMRSERLPEISK